MKMMLDVRSFDTSDIEFDIDLGAQSVQTERNCTFTAL